MRKLREIGKEIIIKRINSIKDGEYVPEDLLSIILKGKVKVNKIFININ